MLDELAASQPTDEVKTDDVMDKGTSEPSNLDGAQTEDTSTPLDNVDGGQDDAAIKAMQKRINKLTAQSKGFEEDLIREQAKAEAYETMQKNSQPETIQDLDASGLSAFIAKAEDDPELEQHLPEAKLELQKRLIQDELSSFKAESAQQATDQQFQAVTNNIIASLSGDRLTDQEGEYFGNASSFLNDLQSDQYSGVNVKQILAVALAENQYLKAQAKGTPMSERVEKNRNRNNNQLQSNNRAVNGNSGEDLADFLKDNSSLSRSNQQGQGSLRQALLKTNAIGGLGGAN